MIITDEASNYLQEVIAENDATGIRLFFDGMG